MLPRLEKSACGCTLYTGSLILAWIGFIGSVMMLLTLIIAGVGILGVKESIDTQPTEKPITDEEETARAAAMTVLTILYGALLAVLIGSVLVHSCLLFGVYKRNHCLMMPYLILVGISLCCNALKILYTFFLMFSDPVMIISFISQIIGTVISGYFWLIIYNFWREVKEEQLSSRQQTTFNKL